MKIGSKWIDQNCKIFVVVSVQDNMVYYVADQITYSCTMQAFQERFREQIQ